MGVNSGSTPSLAASCTTLHVSVLPVADGWPRRRTDAPVGRPPDDETAEPLTQNTVLVSEGGMAMRAAVSIILATTLVTTPVKLALAQASQQEAATV